MTSERYRFGHPPLRQSDHSKDLMIGQKYVISGYRQMPSDDIWVACMFRHRKNGKGAKLPWNHQFELSNWPWLMSWSGDCNGCCCLHCCCLCCYCLCFCCICYCCILCGFVVVICAALVFVAVVFVVVLFVVVVFVVIVFALWIQAIHSFH